MAKIKQGILGGFSGKVANVVGTSWKGRAVMKSQPLSVANPRTTAQMEQRNKFSYIAEFASAILTQFVQPVQNPISGDISGYNMFCKENKSAFNSVGVLTAANLSCGGGQLPNVASVALDEYDSVTDTFSIQFAANSSVALRLTDKVFVVVADSDAKNIWVSGSNVTRQNGAVDAERLKGSDTPSVGNSFVVLYACVSADGRSVSVKTNATTITIS